MAARPLARDVAASSLPGQEDDVCPVCKSSRYLNPNMRFLINPECYHKMCESCVDRLFSSGPGPCPVAGCARTLRKARFRKQVFETSEMEREIDIRGRVAKVFTKREEEFEDLLSWNNYLEEVENLAYELVKGVDVEGNEAKLRAQAAQNALGVLRGAGGEERVEGGNAGGSARVQLEQAPRVVLKKSTARRNAAGKLQPPSSKGVDNAAPPPIFEIKGLKPVVKPEPEKPYSAFEGLEFKQEYYVLQERYEHPWLDKARTDPMITTGGYDVGEYTTRALLEAFSGLGVFIEDEVEKRDSVANKDVAQEAE